MSHWAICGPGAASTTLQSECPSNQPIEARRRSCGSAMKGLAGRFEKTTAGRQEIASRIGTLDRRTRALLIAVDGRTSARDLLARAHQLGLESDEAEYAIPKALTCRGSDVSDGYHCDAHVGRGRARVLDQTCPDGMHAPPGRATA